MIWYELMLIDLRSYSGMLTDWCSGSKSFYLENAILPEFRVSLNSPKRRANLTINRLSVGILLFEDHQTGRLKFPDGSCVFTGAGRHAHQSHFTL